jgi:DNA-binding NarL/FixJ family response regulator
MNASIRVILIDDHEMVAKSLASILEQEPDISVLGSARTSHEGVLLAAATGPDVAIVDYQLPDENGTHTTKDILVVSPQTKVLMLTGATLGTQLVTAAVRAGCIGILTKDKAVHQLVKAVRAAHVGDAYLSSQAVARMVTRARLERKGLGESLTDREREVLQLMAAGHSNQMIAEQLFVSVNTVRNHAQKILLKLAAHSKLEAVAIAYRDGLIELPD